MDIINKIKNFNYRKLKKIFLDLTISSRSSDFEVDILDMIDVRGDLAMPDIVKMIKMSLPPTTTYPNSTAEVLSPKGLKFRVEGMTVEI